jgi:4-hydroxy-tetrahydrodipicolinate reductase
VRLAFFGRGRMGRAVLAQARDLGHDVGVVFSSADAGGTPEQLAKALEGHDAAVDFSAPDAVLAHVAACANARIPLVEGTTGWQEREAEARSLMAQAGGAMVYGANFSIGVNLFYRVVERAGDVFRGLAAYEPYIEEAHHARKRDAPSGTALELGRLLGERLGVAVPIVSTRAGHIPGLHRVGFDSAADEIILVHRARSRDAFAAGALAAARWLVLGGTGTRGAQRFADVLDAILELERKGNP